MIKDTFPLAVLAAAALIAVPGKADEPSLPEGFGISAKYPGDRGIEADPSVLVFESFETGDVESLAKTWSSVSDEDGKVLSFRMDTPAESTGRRCLQMKATVAENTGGHLYRKLPRELDQGFVRFYVKFPEDAGYIHHFVQFGGFHPATEWPQGGAGEKPRGDERMTVGIEPYGGNGKLDPPGAWNFYPYWHEMKASAGGRYWGNSITPETPLLVPRDRWQCVEMMMKTNTPGKRDGELALWLDGKLAMHVKPGTPRKDWTGMGFQLADGDSGTPFEGFNWRTTADLKINFVWMLHYVTQTNQARNRVDPGSGQVTAWFDNIVVSDRYIGPIQPTRQDQKSSDAPGG